MPVRPTYPGVYVEEIPSGVRTIAGVSTAVAAFVGTFPRGLVDRAVQLFSLGDFEREYGGLSADSETSYGIQQFFLNGGTECFVVRVTSANAASAARVLGNGFGSNIVRAAAGRSIRGQGALNPGLWGNMLRLDVDYATRAAALAAETDTLFNLTVSLVRMDGERTVTIASERYVNLTMAAGQDNAINTVNDGSTLVQLDRVGMAALPANNARPTASGTVGGQLAPGTVAPAAVTSLTATLTVGGTAFAIAAFNIPATPAPGRLTDWAGIFQAALRARAAGLPLDIQPYLAEASVEIIGENTLLNPSRFVVRLGRGARPFDPAATISFAGGAVATYALDPAGGGAAQAVVSAQSFTLAGGTNGTMPVDVTRYRGPRATKGGLYALEDVDLFNILCIPDAAAMNGPNMRALYTEAESYCEERRAMVLVDIPAGTSRLDQMQAWLADNESIRHPNAAVYYPRTRVADTLARGRPRSLGPSGTIAGLFARTDTQRGVWKAPAGTDARLRNVQALDYVMTDLENGALNPLGVNCLRTFPVYSSICWGARTLEGADQLASDWKYVPVRRLTLFLEESLYRGTKWAVFEPNDEPLWSQIRLNVGAFMQDLFRKGAFQGATPRDAYFVHCDSETTTQFHIDSGIVNIEVGFAPLKPAEFVILKIQQIARRAEV
ncbi:MAG: phage tail sheath subtilisin-like domain-containing protein [Methylobacterium sp.]|nr:phage tail sheath subtilisin-like domain-containing protein [Methylobacterium sp.]